MSTKAVNQNSLPMYRQIRNTARAVTLTFSYLMAALSVQGQALVIMDRDKNDRVVNDSVVNVYSSDTGMQVLTANFLIRNDGPDTLHVYLRRVIQQMGDSTMDFYCFYTQCWFYADSTDIPNPIPPGGLDYSFIPHVCHVRMFEGIPLEPGLSVIKYTIYDPAAQPQPVEASVTVRYHLESLWRDERKYAEISVFPNPADDFLLLGPGLQPIGEIMVYNSLGANIPVSYVLQGEKISLDVSHLPTGYYAGILQSTDGSRHSFRFVRGR